jgi:hypothetical protein
MSESNTIEEGFWYEINDKESNYPKVEEFIKDTKVPEDFLNKLGEVELYAKKVGYLGYSKCRVCSRNNGDTTNISGEFSFPQGYRHYLEEHNVHPSERFKKFVMNYKTPTVSEFEATLFSKDIYELMNLQRNLNKYPTEFQTLSTNIQKIIKLKEKSNMYRMMSSINEIRYST